MCLLLFFGRDACGHAWPPPGRGFDANEEEEGFALSLSLVALAHRGHCNPCADDLDDVTDDGMYPIDSDRDTKLSRN